MKITSLASLRVNRYRRPYLYHPQTCYLRNLDRVCLNLRICAVMPMGIVHTNLGSAYSLFPKYTRSSSELPRSIKIA